MSPRREENDKEFVTRVMETLGLTQTGVGELIGKAQSSISWIFTRDTKLSTLDRLELERALARDRVVRRLNEEPGVVIPMCTERYDTEVGPNEWLLHLTTCPNCMMLAHRQREEAIQTQRI